MRKLNPGMVENTHISGWLPTAAARMAAAALALAGLIVGPPAAFAADNGSTLTGQICMQKVFGTPVTNANKVNCTANDIRLSRAISVSPNTCIRGTTFNLTATFETIVTANARYDAGFFFRIDGGGNARGDASAATGECSLSALTIPPPPNAPSLNLDGDTCGDLNSGTYDVTFTIPVLCQDSDGDGFLNLPNCTSWHSNSSTPCSIGNAFDFRPDTKSKCVCDDTFQVPATTRTATSARCRAARTISPLALLPASRAAPSLIGQSLAAGASLSCTFQAKVSGNAGQRITDTAVHAAGGGFGQVVSTSCSLPQPAIAPLGNFTCTFVGRIVSSSCDFTHTNIVTCNVTDDDSTTSTPSNSAAVVARVTLMP